ncbi:MAG: hypothetical protein MI919_04115 [Holophagales bacterium]|nr:hypothetical protein [Holophagales bacterium]
MVPRCRQPRRAAYRVVGKREPRFPTAIFPLSNRFLLLGFLAAAAAHAQAPIHPEGSAERWIFAEEICRPIWSCGR